MSEKEAIERSTVDAFISMYNGYSGESYSVEEYADSPDATCRNESGEALNIEVTLTEDRPGDLPWVLGRFEERPVKSRVGSHLQGNVLEQLTKRLESKIQKRYGARTALVIRDSSGVDWDWEDIAAEVQLMMKDRFNPFEMGIWVVNRTKDRLHRLV